MTVKKTEARKRDKNLHHVEVTEVDKVNKRIKIHFLGYSTQFDEWRFFGGDEAPNHQHLLSNAISRTEFVANIGKLRTKLKKTSRSFQFWQRIYNKEMRKRNFAPDPEWGRL